MKIIKTAKYITVLDFEAGRVFQYKIRKDPGQVDDWNPDHESCEEFLVDMGHNLGNIEWMCTDTDYVTEG